MLIKLITRMTLVMSLFVAVWMVVVKNLPYPEWETVAASLNAEHNIDIYLMDWRTGHRLRLTHDAIDEIHPDWSPDGTKIAYLRGSLPYIMDANGENSTNLKVMPTVASLDWSPDGRKILSSSLTSNQLVIFDGTDRVQTITVQSNWIISPEWSPDGEWIVYADFQDIFTFRLTDQTEANLTESIAGEYYAPTWSLDGSRIAFQNQNSLHVINRDGSNYRQLTGYPVQFVKWLSDGHHLVFYIQGENTLYQMNVDHGTTSKLAYQPLQEHIVSLDFK